MDPWITLFATNSPSTNGQRLTAAYSQAVASTPRGSARSDLNRACIALTPGRYELAATLDIANTGIDVVGLGRTAVDVVITSALATATVKNRANAGLSLLTVENTGVGKAVDYIGQATYWTANDCIFTDAINGTRFIPSVPRPARRPGGPKMVATTLFESLTNWAQKDAWRGSHTLETGATPWRGTKYINNIGYKADGGNADEIWMIYTYAAPIDITTKMYAFGYTVIEDEGQNYATTSGGTQVVWTDGTGKTSQQIGLPTQEGRHECCLSWATGTVTAGFDPTNVVSVSIKWRGGLSANALPKPVVRFEDWFEIDCSANTPTFCMGFDDGLIGSINNGIWPAIRLGIPTYLAHRFDYTGIDANYATEANLEELYSTGLVELAHHSSTYPASSAEQMRIEYLRHCTQEVISRGYSTRPIFVVPQGLAGGGATNRCTIRDVQLMLQHCYGVRTVDDYVTGLNGTSAQQSGPPVGVLPGRPFINGLLPSGKIASANLTTYTAAGGVIDRIVSAKQSLILYCHNVTDNAGDPLPDMTVADCATLLAKLNAVRSAGSRLVFMDDLLS